ncbi:MAG TPA: hypothetical protein VFD13_08960, partial [Candidatus Kapabacteria bacterium]|nr:hypothetical protein [Candidatus Kapabacteria bacterium]
EKEGAVQRQKEGVSISFKLLRASTTADDPYRKIRIQMLRERHHLTTPFPSLKRRGDKNLKTYYATS